MNNDTKPRKHEATHALFLPTPCSPRIVQLSARFSHRTMRIRGATELETATWYRALRQAAGLPPLHSGASGLGPPGALRAIGSSAPRGVVSRIGEQLGGDDEAPGEAEEALDAAGGAQRDLTMSQRCSWLYLTGGAQHIKLAPRACGPIARPPTTPTTHHM